MEINKRKKLILLFTASLTISASFNSAAEEQNIAVSPQYDTVHVYVTPGKMDAFVDSILNTFGGKKTTAVTVNVTPTASKTISQLILTPVGSFSVFDFKTPIPYPFGSERNGFLVKDMDKAISEARSAGADIIVEPFPDPIGRDAVVQWPGGVNMQLYWHTKAPDYSALQSIPESRYYLSTYRINDFIKSYLRFSKGTVVSDELVDASIIGKKSDTVRTILISSDFGKTRLFVTDGHLDYPFGRESMGYGVKDLSDTLKKALSSGATIVWKSTEKQQPPSAIVQFPGGYLAEIHEENM